LRLAQDFNQGEYFQSLSFQE